VSGKENQELRQELTAVRQELVKVLGELKKLKKNSTGQDSEKLTQQIVQNERLIENSGNVSEAKVKEQISKSRALMKEVNTSSSSTKKENNIVSLPYLIGGSTIVISAVVIGYSLLKKNKKNKIT